MSSAAATVPPVLVVGEALVDAVRRPGDGSGEEEAHPGGSPLNVAVGLARLGVPALLHSSLAEDADGRLVLGHLAANGVPVTGTTVAPDGTTSRALALIGADGAATYDFAITWAPQPLEGGAAGAVAAARAVHVGSISAFIAPGAALVDEVVREAAAQGVPVSFDPNARPALLDGPEAALGRVEALAAHTTVLKLSDEDAAYLMPGLDEDAVVDRLVALGPALVVLTCGGEGLLGAVGDLRVRVPGAVVEVADTIGAGDTVSAAFLAWALRHGLPRTEGELRAALEAAAEAAGVTVSRPGADPPRLAELGAAWQG